MIKKILIGLPLFLFAMMATPFSTQAHDLGCSPPFDACRAPCNQVLINDGSEAFVSCLDACYPSYAQCQRAGPFPDCWAQRWHCPCGPLVSFHMDQFNACNDACTVQYNSCQEMQSKPVDPVSKPVDPVPVMPAVPDPAEPDQAMPVKPILPEPVEPDQTITPEKEPQGKDAEKLGKPYATTMEYGKDIKEGDTVKAGKKETVTIIYPDGSKIVMKPGSSMNVKSWIELIRGKFEFWVNKMQKKFEIRTPTAIGAIRGTEFTVDATSLKTVVRVYDSIVDVSDKNGKNTVGVRAGYQVTVTKKKVGKPTKILPSLIRKWKAHKAQPK